MHRRGEMTVRVAYNLFTQRPRQNSTIFEVGQMTKPARAATSTA